MQPPSALLAGRYRFLASLQAGAKAVAWTAQDSQSGRDVLVSALASARIEALKTGVGVAHPHLAALLDVVEAPDPAAIPGGRKVSAVAVASHVRGETLHARLKRGPLEPALAVDWFARLAEALAVLHKAGGVHGAISPRSIVVSPEGEDPGPVLTQLVAPSSGAYCAPERLQGRGPSMADDVWALHATLFAALTCSPPFRGETKDQLLLSIAGGRQQRLESLGVSDPVLSELLERGLLADLTRRRATIEEVVDAFDAWTPADGDWSDDEATLVASSRTFQALAQADTQGLRRPEPVPSVPPVAIDAEADSQAPPEDPSGDDDAHTTVMDRQSGEVAAAIAALDAKLDLPRSSAVPTPRVPVQAQVHDAPTPPAPAQAVKPVSATAETPVARPNPAFPPVVDQFPPAVSQFPPPVMPSTLPAAIEPSLDDEIVVRSAGKKPLIVILVVLGLIALGISVALYMNHRASRSGRLRSEVLTAPAAVDLRGTATTPACRSAHWLTPS